MHDLILQLAAFDPDEGWVPGLGDRSAEGYFTVAHYFVAVALCFWAALAARRAPRFGVVKLESPMFWWVFFLFVLVLGINKQLDLQSAITHYGREASKEQGWYDERDQVKSSVIVAVGIGCAIAFAGFLAITLPYWWRNLRGLLGAITAAGKVPDDQSGVKLGAIRLRARLYAVFGVVGSLLMLVGIVFLLKFIAVRTTSLHQEDILRESVVSLDIVGLLIFGSAQDIKEQAAPLIAAGRKVPFRLNTIMENTGIAMILLSALLGIVRIAMQRRTMRKLIAKAPAPAS
ncbi:MAG: hypothetical protein CMJ49_00715 [Planctomycetaceae bacterium]|nr:hypothetical protein [Planctomycetaceae bacterium]